jgi:CRISPR/Cas system-associated exonuclease Cas4 (RecB family)
MKVLAVVQYLDNHYEIDEKDYSGIWNEALKAQSMLLDDNPPKEKIPSGLCKFCDLREDCEYWSDI